MKLLPKSVHAYNEYWQSIRSYNTWFIKLRWFAGGSLFACWFILQMIPGIEFILLQSCVIFFVSALIIIYNFCFHKVLQIEKSALNSNPLGFSLIQIILDLTSLSFVVYISGGLESPIFIFYIFHMIIGSLILPAFIMYSLAGILIITFSLLGFLEYFEVIPHFILNGLFPFSLYNNPGYIAVVLVVFASAIIIAVLLTSKISSELYEREKRLKKALDELNESEKSKQKYVMAVVHELKSPIVASLSQIELVLGNYVGEIGENIRLRIQNARDRSLKAIEMINNILHISKFKLFNNYQKEKILLSPIIASVLKNITAVVELKEIAIEFSDKADTDILIDADKVLFELALSNLIGNAIKYTPNRGTIQVNMKDKEKFRIIEIIDNGIGIPAGEQKRIFEDHYRGSNANSTEGSGVGLSAVKQIIESHNGKIELKSPSRIGNNERPGTEFIIFLPRK